MRFENGLFKLRFKNSRQRIETTLDQLILRLVRFLDSYGEQFLLGEKFCSIIGDGNGWKKFFRLLQKTGYIDNSLDFFSEVLSQLESSKIIINVSSINLPYLLILDILEELIPQKGFVSVKSVAQLEELTNIAAPKEERIDLQKVIDTYPVRLSWHVIRQMKISKAVAYQYMPFAGELDAEGLTNTWVGQFHRGVLEQMYQNRPIFVLNMACPVYCRFCFRKHKDCRNQKTPTVEDVKKALAHIEKSPQIKEVVLTGGDPFMNRKTLACAVDGLSKIPHIETLRVATRSIAYYPNLFFRNNSFWLIYLKELGSKLMDIGKNLEIATHFIHPDEISIDSLAIINELTKCGVRVYAQTPFLGGCNDRGPELVELYTKLRAAGAEMHYIYIPCSPIQGNKKYLTPISKGLEVARYLRANLSDRAMPKICTATSIGKIDWGTSGWAVEPDKNDERYIWLRAPYTLDYFKSFAPDVDISGFTRVNKEGTLDVRFMAEIGDTALFRGLEKKSEKAADTRPSSGAIETGSHSLARTHKTRVEINDTDYQLLNNEVNYNLEYIRDNNEISEVLIYANRDALSSSAQIFKFIEQVQEIPHISIVRLSFAEFNYEPEKFTDEVISRLASLNKPDIKNPKRLEIETQFLHSSEFSPEHKNLTARLRRRGITVYSNTILLAGINDSAEELLRISCKCRQMGIEFHHLYAAGLDIQENPVCKEKIIEIATNLRKYGSGREIPHFIKITKNGEADFGY